MKKIVILTLVASYFFTSCSTLKIIKLIRAGEVEQQDYSVNVPFETRAGLIIIKVNISGEEYDFLLDTEAPNVISKELATRLDINNIVKQQVADSQDEESNLGFATIEKISIGGIHFLNAGIAIADLNQSKEIGCLKIDGLIGANLMKKAIWKFDYKNQIITITNSIDSLSIPASAHKIPFNTEITGTPNIKLKINDVTQKRVTFDLGSNGHISLSKKTYDTIIKDNPSIPQTFSFGNSGSGLYGRGNIDTTYYLKAASISFGDISMDSTIVEFISDSGSTIGSEIFKNYDIIINWFSKKITLINQTEYDNTTLSTFGFSFSNHEDKLIISEVYEKMENLKIGDQIVSLNETKFKELAPDQWCDIVINGLIKGKEEISLTILRNNKESTFSLRKMNLIK